jgi:Ig-like domain CHU_C associated/Dual-action HEIGH metallo-peptidase
VKQIRLLTAVTFLVASAASATVFQPATDRQLIDRSEAVVVATVRDAASHLQTDGHVVTDYRLDVEQTLKGTAAGTITVSEIGGVAGSRFTFISDSAAYTPGERVMVFLRKRGDGTYFTTSMAMGKFSFTRNATGQAVVTRDVSELRDDPARMANAFERFVAGKTTEAYTTKLTPIADALHPNALGTPASAYCVSFGSPLRWNGGEFNTIHFYVTGTMPNVPNAAGNIGSGLGAWTGDPNAGITLAGSGAPPAGTSATPVFDGNNVIYLNQAPPNTGICDSAVFCTVLSGNTDTTHTFHGETFISIQDADIVMGGSAGPTNFEALITHELGHAIGFRHADQGNPQSFAAIMSSNVNSSFGSALQQWDRDAVDTVYGNGPPCNAPTSVSISGGGAVSSGQTAFLMANVGGGSGTFTYAWFDGSLNDTSNPVGTNSPNFTTPPITGTKHYWVKVTNGCDTTNVTAATTVFVQQNTCTPAGIFVQPSPQTISSGGTATLSVSASGSELLSYQWYQATNNSDTSTPVGSNSAFFTTPALTQSTSYYVKVSNQCGTAVSDVVTVSIAGSCTKPSFSIQPSSSIPVPGSQTFLIAFASGATSYQWYKGNAGDTSTPLTGSGPSNNRWINQIYIDLLGRPADATALSTLGGLLGSNTPRPTVALSVLTSNEYRQRLLTSFYSTFLHRTPSAAEISFWMPAFTAGLTDEQIEQQILASPEYFALAGSTNAGWVGGIFHDVLGRTPSAAETSSFSTLISSSSRLAVGLGILNSNEAVTRRVQQYYPLFLRRPATGAETSAFVTAILGGSTDEQVIAQIVGADEYFNFGTLLVTDPITTTTRYWVRATNACGPTDSATAILTIPQCETTIITQPHDATVNVGSPVRLSVLATASGILSYQWYRAASGDPSNPVPGGTGPVVTITPTQTGITQYWVKVSNACSSMNSNTVTLTVNCAPRVLILTDAPTAPSASPYTVSWNGDANLDFSSELQEATKADFSDAQTFPLTGATVSRIFTHTVTADTRYYYRIHVSPLCGGDYGSFSQTNSVLVTAPLPPTKVNFDFAQTPCTPPNCTIRQPIFIPGIVTNGKTALATDDSFTATSDKAFMTISPSSGPLPPEGTTVTATIDLSQLDAGSTQATVTITRIPAAGKTGALGDPPAPVNVPISISVVAPVTPGGKDPNAGFNALLIPAVAHADGISSSFVSDVRLTNTSSQAINYQLTYTPNGTDGTVSGQQTTITVNAGDTKALNDIVKDFFGAGVLGQPPQGSLEIRPLNYAGKDPVSISLATVAASRTYSVAANGTFGQYIPALPLVNFLAKSDVSKVSLQQVSQSNAAGAFRTNLGFIEGSGQAVDFVATLLDDAGNKVAERSYSLKPYESQQQKLDQFFSVPSITDGRVEVRVTSDTGHVSAYASVLDNTTTDPLLVFPADPSKIAAQRFVIPGVAEFSSAFSNFHTDMRVYNGGSSPVDVTLTFNSSSSGVPSISKVQTIAAGATLAVNNVLPTLFNTTGGGSVVATTANDAQLVLTARTFSRDQTSGGTFGQFIPGVTAADAVGNGDRALQIVQLEESPAFRTNLGLVEVTGNSASVELLAYTPDSKVASRTVVPLNAGQYLQQNQIFKSLGFSNVYNGRITARVISGNGRVAAYGSVIDNRTTDPTYVPSQ